MQIGVDGLVSHRNRPQAGRWSGSSALLLSKLSRFPGWTDNGQGHPGHADSISARCRRRWSWPHAASCFWSASFVPKLLGFSDCEKCQSSAKGRDTEAAWSRLNDLTDDCLLQLQGHISRLRVIGPRTPRMPTRSCFSGARGGLPARNPCIPSFTTGRRCQQIAKLLACASWSANLHPKSTLCISTVQSRAWFVRALRGARPHAIVMSVAPLTHTALSNDEKGTLGS